MLIYDEKSKNGLEYIIESNDISYIYCGKYNQGYRIGFALRMKSSVDWYYDKKEDMDNALDLLNRSLNIKSINQMYL